MAAHHLCRAPNVANSMYVWLVGKQHHSCWSTETDLRWPGFLFTQRILWHTRLQAHMVPDQQAQCWFMCTVQVCVSPGGTSVMAEASSAESKVNLMLSWHQTHTTAKPMFHTERLRASLQSPVRREKLSAPSHIHYHLSVLSLPSPIFGEENPLF